MLEFDPKWRFEGPGPISVETVHAIRRLIDKIATQGNRWWIIEHFKSFFASAHGETSVRSTSESWADTDLDRDMQYAAENAPLFLEAFYDAVVALRNREGMAIPDLELVNRILAETNALYMVRPPKLLQVSVHETVVVSPAPPSLSEEGQALVRKSLTRSDEHLARGEGRQAVQELLWCVESVSTAFRGVELSGGTIGGKYFNEIVKELRRHQKGTMLDRALDWLGSLHGYLSSPTGGAVRHGQDLAAGVALEINDARLICNLVRSYLDYLMVEHHRLTSGY